MYLERHTYFYKFLMAKYISTQVFLVAKQSSEILVSRQQQSRYLLNASNEEEGITQPLIWYVITATGHGT